MSEKYCQQWTLQRGTFAAWVSARSGVHPRIVLAWMAVESGGDPIAPRGARHNYLQIKERGDAGQTAEGFAIYSTPLAAANAAVRRIKAEKNIGRAIGKGAPTVMHAIADTWDDGPGVTVGGTNQSYYNRLKAKFDCISKQDVIDGGFVGIRAGIGDEQLTDRELTERLGNVAESMKKDGPLSAAGQLAKEAAGAAGEKAAGSRLADALGGFADDLWPVLLKSAMAATGLALIGFGLVKATGAGAKAREAATKATPVAAGVASARGVS